MHEAVRTYYHKIKKAGFEHVGNIEDAAISLKAFGELSPVCGNTDDFLYLYLQVKGGVVTDIKYQCITDPTTNVAIEVLCELTKGVTLQDALIMQDDAFMQFLGCEDKLMRRKAGALLEMLRGGILSYQAKAS